jgi:rhodanese-related sulfurtransferase
MMVFSCVVAVAALFGGCQDTVSDKDIMRVSLAEVQRLTKPGANALLLDPRPAPQYQAGHIPGAVNVTLDELPSDKKAIRADLASPKVVVVYGANPGDGYAIAATKRLLRAGQNGARLFSGGLAEWRSAGLKVEAAAAGAPAAN